MFTWVNIGGLKGKGGWDRGGGGGGQDKSTNRVCGVNCEE